MDIALDPFPYSGGLTTCEALWMGCPTVTLYGDRPTSRLSSSVMMQLGLPQFIGHSSDQFVSICERLAQDPAPLESIRAGLREKMRTLIGDGATFTRQLEDILRQMWRRWAKG